MTDTEIIDWLEKNYLIKPYRQQLDNNVQWAVVNLFDGKVIAIGPDYRTVINLSKIELERRE
jgi:hypothetical protein